MAERLIDVITEYGGVEVSPLDMYSDVFKLGEGYIQKSGEYRNFGSTDFKGNPIGYWKDPDEEKGHFRVMTEDNFGTVLKELQEADWSLLGGVSYFGRRPLSSHSDKVFSLIIDVDEVMPVNLKNFFSGAFSSYDIYPLPQYIVISRSGKGLHLYYVLEEPVSLFPNIRLQAKELKYELTRRIWNRNTSSQKKVEQQGIFQRFRVAGAKADKGVGDEVCRCFVLNRHPTSFEELSRYTSTQFMFDKEKRFKESSMTLAEAKKKYPKWYEKVVVNKDKSVNKWDIKGKVHGDDPYALYHWWYRRITTGEASVGHRYFCVMALVIMAVKNDYPFEQLKEDCYGLIPMMNEVNPDEEFTKNDVDSALECYDDRYCTFPNTDISRLTNIEIVPNKRNGRKQEKHLQLARGIRVIKGQMGETVSGGGRPSAKQKVLEWQKSHPEGKKAECIRETGLSKPTVYKWWLPVDEVLAQKRLDEELDEERRELEREMSSTLFWE